MHSRGAPRNCETPTLRNLPGEQRQTPAAPSSPLVHLSHCSALRRRKKKKKDFPSSKYMGSASRRVGCSELKMQRSQLSRRSYLDIQCCLFCCLLVCLFHPSSSFSPTYRKYISISYIDIYTYICQIYMSCYSKAHNTRHGADPLG